MGPKANRESCKNFPKHSTCFSLSAINVLVILEALVHLRAKPTEAIQDTAIHRLLEANSKARDFPMYNSHRHSNLSHLAHLLTAIVNQFRLSLVHRSPQHLRELNRIHQCQHLSTAMHRPASHKRQECHQLPCRTTRQRVLHQAKTTTDQIRFVSLFLFHLISTR